MDVREKLVELIGEVQTFGLDYSNISAVCKTSNDTLANHLVAHGVTVQEWIPVTERLPGTEKVLITDGEIVMRGYRRPDGVWKYGIELHEVWERLSLKRVTHWMPLPQPPKGE